MLKRCFLKTMGLSMLKIAVSTLFLSYFTHAAHLGFHDHIETADINQEDILVVGTHNAGKIMLFDLKSQAQPIRKAQHAGITDLSFSPDGQKIVSCGAEKVIIWSTSDFEILSHYKSNAFQARFSPDGRSILLSGLGLVKVIRTSSGLELFSLPINNTGKAFFNHQGNIIVVVNFNENSLSLHSAHNGSFMALINNIFWPSHVLFSHDDSKIFIASGLQIKIYDLIKKDTKILFNDHECDNGYFNNWILHIQLNENNNLLSAIDNEGRLISVNTKEKSNKIIKINRSLIRNFFMRSESSVILVDSYSIKKVRHGSDEVLNLISF